MIEFLNWTQRESVATINAWKFIRNQSLIHNGTALTVQVHIEKGTRSERARHIECDDRKSEHERRKTENENEQKKKREREKER